MATVRQLWERLVDDAAIFPPGNAPLERAVAEHRDHLASSYAGLMGPFVVSDKRLPELLELVDEERPLAVSVVVTGGAGAIEPAVTWASRSAALTLRGVEVALLPGGHAGYSTHPAAFARRLVEVLGTR